jgi:hypothetical protein
MVQAGMITMSLVKPTGIKMSRILICPVCKKEWDLRWGIMGNESMARHMKDCPK